MCIYEGAAPFSIMQGIAFKPVVLNAEEIMCSFPIPVYGNQNTTLPEPLSQFFIHWMDILTFIFILHHIRYCISRAELVVNLKHTLLAEEMKLPWFFFGGVHLFC